MSICPYRLSRPSKTVVAEFFWQISSLEVINLDQTLSRNIRIIRFDNSSAAHTSYSHLCNIRCICKIFSWNVTNCFGQIFSFLLLSLLWSRSKLWFCERTIFLYLFVCRPIPSPFLCLSHQFTILNIAPNNILNNILNIAPNNQQYSQYQLHPTIFSILHPTIHIPCSKFKPLLYFLVLLKK